MENYRFYMENFPVLCVDIVFFNTLKTEVLLFMRKNKPQKGVFYTTGGRLLKNENLEEAVARKAKQETGLHIDTQKLVFGGVINEPHPDSIFPGVSYHGVTLYWGYIIEEDIKIILDNQHDKYEWFSVNDQSIHPFIKERIETLLKVLK